MGLDMFLDARLHVDSDDIVDLTKANTGTTRTITSVKTIQFEVGYWRKANAIHNWFVKNVQNGQDDCGEYRVTYRDIAQLKTVCEQVVASCDSQDFEKIAIDKLPPLEGFFFGSTEIGQSYIDTIHKTIDICDRALALLSDDNPDLIVITYHASW